MDYEITKEVVLTFDDERFLVGDEIEIEGDFGQLFGEILSINSKENILELEITQFNSKEIAIPLCNIHRMQMKE